MTARNETQNNMSSEPSIEIIYALEDVFLPSDGRLTYNAGTLVPYNHNGTLLAAFYLERFSPFLELNSEGSVDRVGIEGFDSRYLCSFTKIHNAFGDGKDQFRSLVEEQLAKQDRTLEDTAVLFYTFHTHISRILAETMDVLNSVDYLHSFRFSPDFPDDRVHSTHHYTEALKSQKEIDLEMMRVELSDRVENDAGRFRNKLKRNLKRIIGKGHQKAYCCLDDVSYEDIRSKRRLDLSYLYESGKVVRGDPK